MLTRGKSVLIDDLRSGHDRRPRAPVRAFCTWATAVLCAAGTSTTSIRLVETGWSTIPSSIDTEFSKSFTIPERSGIAGRRRSLRHSVGVGLRQGLFSLAVAFPVRDGRIEPIFMVGMNY